jgi:hypothetical protein
VVFSECERDGPAAYRLQPERRFAVGNPAMATPVGEGQLLAGKYRVDIAAGAGGVGLIAGGVLALGASSSNKAANEEA